MASFQQPFLQHIQTANGFQGFFGFNQFQEAVLLHGLGFFPGDNYRVDGFGFDHRQGKGILSFNRGQPGSGIQDFVSLLSFHVFDTGGFNDAVQDQAELLFTWKCEFDDGDFSFQFRGQAQTATQDDEGLVLGFGSLQNVLELADEDGVGILQEQVEVAQEDDGLFLQILDGDKGFQRVVGCLDCPFLESTRPSTTLQKEGCS